MINKKNTNNLNLQNSLKSTSTLVPSYVMKRIILDKDTVKDFSTDDANRRMIRQGKVNSMLKNLNKGEHFDAPFVINETENKSLLIDGNHRMEAIKLKIGIDKNFSIAVWFAIYRDLSEEECRNVFELWNIGTPQTATDFLKIYWKTIPLARKILNELPVTLYGTEDKMPIKYFVGSHIIAKKQRNFNGGYGSGREGVVGDFSNLTEEDIETMKDFYNFMVGVFGIYHKGNNCLFYKTTPIPVFYRIWYDNRDIDSKKLIPIWNKVFASQVGAWKEICSSGGRNAQVLFYNQALSSLNAMQKRVHFKSDKEIVPTKDRERKTLEAFDN